MLLTKEKLVRLVQNALQGRIEEELPLEVNDLILTTFKDDAEELRGIVTEKKKKFKVEDFGRIRTTRLPPCMYRLLAMVQSGEGISHSGRFALTAFLHTIGLSSDQILAIFSNIADFDESKTRYQIEHITGQISGTEYTPPECSTMKSYNLCPGPDELCSQEWVKHPLTYYRVKGRKAKASSK